MQQDTNINTLELSYTRVAKLLHWLIAFLIISNYLIGETREYFSQQVSSALITLHIQFGLSLIVLVVLRIIWRLTHQYPQALVTIHPHEKTLAKVVHLILYVLMLIIPITGAILVQAHGYPLKLWGMLAIPTFIPSQSHAIGDTIKEIHSWLALIIIWLVGLHLVGALKHHFIDKDRTLLRMLPSFRLKHKQD